MLSYYITLYSSPPRGTAAERELRAVWSGAFAVGYETVRAVSGRGRLDSASSQQGARRDLERCRSPYFRVGARVRDSG